MLDPITVEGEPMSERNTAHADLRQAHRARTARWRQAALALALTLAASGAPVWAQDVNPDSTGREPVITRMALEKARPVTANPAMVVRAQHLATMVGVDILKRGGTAVDAAAAVGFAEAVVHPCCGNIGGGGFMTIHLKDGRTLFLNFREQAPLKATPKMFQDADGNVVEGRSTDSYLGVGVPGTVMGFDTALKAYGTMSLKQVIEPAIKLAREGYILKQGDVDSLESRTEDFARHANVAAIFLNHGKPFKVGERLVQKDLANTLEMIADKGTDAFYKGPIAEAVVEASEANGGILSMRDFADYTAQWEKPVTCEYRGYTVVSAPPPSSGGTTVCLILQLIKPYPLAKWGYGSVESVHYIAEAERRAFADRNTYLGDPAFVHNPIDELLSPAHVDKLRATIQPDKATLSSDIKGSLGAPESRHTTHYSVMDKDGNGVAVTYTVNSYFGIKQIAGDTGFFLNNEMDDFTAKPGVPNKAGLVTGVINQIEPGKRPLSSMTPTLVLRDGKLFMLTGSPGDGTIISTTMESIVNVVDFGMNLQQSINAPRMHQQWFPQTIFVEPGLMTPQTRQTLEAMGHTFTVRDAIGADEAIMINPRNGQVEGANDRRRPAGLAAGH
jgi:gamma-glutamyltranspeptidase/glutathione hydrolase